MGLPDRGAVLTAARPDNQPRIESMEMFGTDVISVLNRLFLQGDDDGGISLAAFVSPPR